MSVGRAFSFSFALFAFAFFASCGKDGTSAGTSAPEEFIDGGFEGAFASRGFECVNGERATPVERADELRRTMLIVSDHLLVTDSNSFELLSGKRRAFAPGAGMADVVSRYYEVKDRAIVGEGPRAAIRVELAEPKSGAVYKVASSFGDRAVGAKEFHPVSAALREASAQSWVYFFADSILHVYVGNVPAGVCSETGAKLHITFEKLKID